MSEPRPVATYGHPRGRPSSWLLVTVVIGAVIGGGVALILGMWWLFFAMAGVFVVCVPAGAAAGIMNDTVAWTTPLPGRYRPPRGTVVGSSRPNQERRVRRPSESDVAADSAHAGTRATGGVPKRDTPDMHSTTGTTPSGVFVGRAAPDDVGYVEKTGAEARAEAERARRSS